MENPDPNPPRPFTFYDRTNHVLPQEHQTLSGTGGDFLEVVDKVTLLGVKLRCDMRFSDNTDFICQKGYARLWMIRRLKNLGASQSELIDIYQKQVRSVLELAVSVCAKNK